MALKPECEELAKRLLEVEDTFAAAAFEANARRWGAALQNVEDGMTQLDTLLARGEIDWQDKVFFGGAAAILSETIREELIGEDPLAMANDLHREAEQLLVDKLVECECER